MLPAALAANSLESLVLLESPRYKQPHTSTPGPHWGRPKSSRAASGANPVDDPHAEVEIKPQLKPRGSVAKEEDPKPSHQQYRLQIKSTGSMRQTLCLWNI